tara:strand:- start:43 stop:978 length:936 start_codon:yes stop_codon:yes gene_type:complete
MTTQRDLGLIWATSGGTTVVDSSKYTTGWVAEIPTFQQFNYMVQGLDQNILALAEQHCFEWQNDINYSYGAKVYDGGQKYTAILPSINQQPSTDSTNSYWVTGDYYGDGSALIESDGLRIEVSNHPVSNWLGQDLTIRNTLPMISLFTENAAKNWGVANHTGDLVAVDLGTATDTVPDNRNLAKSTENVFKIYHEANKPEVGDVANAVEEAPQDGKFYARKDGVWVEVTTTTVSTAPPPPTAGDGQGWFNLEDGQFYTDISDGDSSQWVVANPPFFPELSSNEVPFTSNNGLSSTDVKAALDELKALIDAI